MDRLMNLWLKDKNIETYSTHNEGKSTVSKKDIRTLKKKIYKYMTSISENVYIGQLNDIVDKYNKTYSRTIKMTPIHVKSTSYTDLNVENNEKDPKFTVDDHVRISKYKNIFGQCYIPNWSEEVFITKKVKNIKP